MKQFNEIPLSCHPETRAEFLDRTEHYIKRAQEQLGYATRYLFPLHTTGHTHSFARLTSLYQETALLSSQIRSAEKEAQGLASEVSRELASYLRKITSERPN